MDKQKQYLLITNSTALAGSTLTLGQNTRMFDEGISSEGKTIAEQLLNLDLKTAYDAAVKENDDQYGKLAYQAWERGKELSVALYGEMHPLVMHGYKDMCLVCDDDLEKALKLSLKALDLSIAIYGPDHPLTGRPYHYVGVIYRELEKWPEWANKAKFKQDRKERKADKGTYKRYIQDGDGYNFNR